MGRERVFIATSIMTNAPQGTLYVGVTSNLHARVRQHRDKTFEGFTAKYGLERLVWFQPFEFMTSAIRCEKRVKHYVRAWKVNLIERDNRHWEDLAANWDQPPVWKHGPTEG